MLLCFGAVVFARGITNAGDSDLDLVAERREAGIGDFVRARRRAYNKPDEAELRRQAHRLARVEPARRWLVLVRGVGVRPVLVLGVGVRPVLARRVGVWRALR